MKGNKQKQNIRFSSLIRVWMWFSKSVFDLSTFLIIITQAWENECPGKRKRRPETNCWNHNRNCRLQKPTIDTCASDLSYLLEMFIWITLKHRSVHPKFLICMNDIRFRETDGLTCTIRLHAREATCLIEWNILLTTHVSNCVRDQPRSNGRFFVSRTLVVHHWMFTYTFTAPEPCPQQLLTCK